MAERDITAVGTHRDDVPPIGTQISLLAAEAPEAPAVTCDGRTLTRGPMKFSRRDREESILRKAASFGPSNQSSRLARLR